MKTNIKGRLARLLAAGIFSAWLTAAGMTALAAPAWSLPDSGLQLDAAAKQAYVQEKMGKIFRPAANTPTAVKPFTAPDGWQYESYDIGSCNVEKLVNPQAKTNRVVLQLHGGGYINGLGNGHRALGVKQMVLTNARKAYLVDYRTAPAHTYPAALEDAVQAYEDILARKATPILCGGTGLYIESVLKGYMLSPVPQNQALRDALADKSLEELTEQLRALKAKTGSNMHNKTDVDSVQRAIRAIEIETYNLEHPTPEREFPSIDSLVIGVNIDRDARREKITRRLKDRLEHGMVDEIKGLLERGIPAEDLIYYGLEYKYITEYIIGKLSYKEMFRQLEIAIHQFAKRQMTWFRGMERRGFTIHWIDALLPIEDKVNEIKRLMQYGNNGK